MSEAILTRAGVTKSYVDSKFNDLGTASKCDTGTSEGNVPVINSNGKLDNSVIPSLAITDIFTASSEEEMLALSAEQGDLCVRTDESKTYILQSEPATELSNWIEIASPTDSVQSVNGKTGTVVLTADDIEGISGTYEVLSNKSDSYTESSSTTYASTKALVDGLSTKAEVAKYSASIGTSWTQGDNNEYTQEISINGILESDNPMIDVVLDSDVTTAQSQLEAWSYISRIVTSDDKITVYCYDSAPSVEIPIQIICIR